MCVWEREKSPQYHTYVKMFKLVEIGLPTLYDIFFNFTFKTLNEQKK